VGAKIGVASGKAIGDGYLNAAGCLTIGSAAMAAKLLKLDVEKFLADYNSSKYDRLIQDDINLGRASGVTGTPTLFVNGKRMQRRSFDDFKSRIEEIKKEKKS